MKLTVTDTPPAHTHAPIIPWRGSHRTDSMVCGTAAASAIFALSAVDAALGTSPLSSPGAASNTAPGDAVMVRAMTASCGMKIIQDTAMTAHSPMRSPVRDDFMAGGVDCRSQMNCATKRNRREGWLRTVCVSKCPGGVRVGTVPARALPDCLEVLEGRLGTTHVLVNSVKG